jgi:hypothetical protein
MSPRGLSRSTLRIQGQELYIYTHVPAGSLAEDPADSGPGTICLYYDYKTWHQTGNDERRLYWLQQWFFAAGSP